MQDRTGATSDTPDESLVYWGGAAVNVPGDRKPYGSQKHDKAARKIPTYILRPFEHRMLESHNIRKTATVIKK